MTVSMESRPYQKSLCDLAAQFVTRDLGISPEHPLADSPKFLVECALKYKKRTGKIEDIKKRLRNLHIPADNSDKIVVSANHYYFCY